LTLTTASPAGRCHVPGDHPRLVEIPIRPARNPAGGPVDVRVTLSPTVTGETVTSAFSLYPADRPAAFVVRVPAMATGAEIGFSLLPGTAPLTVVVGPLVWRYGEVR
jgi:hypothetical protein